MNTDPIHPDPGSPEEHWSTHNPQAQPPLDQIKGLPRLVVETHTRLGPNATPERVAEELRKQGIDTTAEEVRSLWPESGKLTG